MDAFFAAVEQLDCPALRGRPVLVGGTGRRAVVCTASYEARPFGCRSAQPMGEALRRCPAAVVVPPRFARYTEVSATIQAVFARFSPLVEPLSLDEAFLEMTGAEGLFGPPAELARRLKEEVRAATGGLTVSVGVAPNKFVAKVASDHHKPDGMTIVPPDEVLGFLWPLGVERLWGVGPKTRQRLAELGVTTIRDLARLPPDLLVRRLGSHGAGLHELAWARDDRPVEPGGESKSIGAEQTLEEDVRGERQILPLLRQSASRVARQLRQEGLCAGGVRVKLKTAAFRLLTRQASLLPPGDSEQELLRVATRLLDAFDLEQPMRLVGLAAYKLVPASGSGQAELFPDPEREKQRRLDRALDRVRARFGEGALHRGGAGGGGGA
jgi:DNA polymerase-4